MGEDGKWYAPVEPARVVSSGQPEDLAARVTKLEHQVDVLRMQNGLLVEAWRRFRQGQFAGAGGIDGLIVTLQGGGKLGLTATYPKA